MTTKPKSTKAARREALERMTKGELVKTVLSLDARQTKLLNEVANAKDNMSDAHHALARAAVALQTDNTRLTVRATELEMALRGLHAGINEDRLLRINPDALETVEIEVLSPEDQAKRGGFKVTRRPSYVKPAITEKEFGEVAGHVKRFNIVIPSSGVVKFPWEA